MIMLPARSSLGDILGQGLSDLATHYADIKTNENALKKMGIDPLKAQGLARLNPALQQQALGNLFAQQQQAQSNQAINQILGLGLGQQQPQAYAPQVTAQPQSGAPSRMPMPQLPHEAQQAAIQQATSIAQNPAFRKLNEQQQGAQALQQQQLARPQGAPAQAPITGEQAAILQAQAQQRKEPTLKDQIEQIRAQKRALAAANLPANQAIALHQQLEAKERDLRKESREERKLEQMSQKEIDKETLPTYHEINKTAKAGKDSNIRLGRMEQLINKGNLSNTAFYNGIKALGKLPGIGGYIESIAESFLSPDTQEFEKLSTDFIKDAKQFFGNRITQQEVMMFLKTVPNLSQTNAGKKRVIRNMRIFNEAAQVRKDIMDKLIQQNGGKRPANLEALIEQEASPQLDTLASEFKGA